MPDVMSEEIRKAVDAISQDGIKNATSEQKQLASQDWLARQIAEPLHDIKVILYERLPNSHNPTSNTVNLKRTIMAKGAVGGTGAGIGALALYAVARLLDIPLF